MRRKTVIVILLLSALAFSALCLAACDRDSSEDDRPKDISRMVSAFYAGECEDFAVTFERGSKEEPFIADGKTTSVVDFSSLRVIPLRATEVSEISFTLAGAAGESPPSSSLRRRAAEGFLQNCAEKRAVTVRRRGPFPSRALAQRRRIG